MGSRLWLICAPLAALLGTSTPAYAGGNAVAITALHGDVQIKSLHSGSQWRPARRGLLWGSYLLRTGPRSWAHLEERGGWRPRRLGRGCMDASSLLRVHSSCGFQIDVLRGQISSQDGRRGRGRFKTVGG